MPKRWLQAIIIAVGELYGNKQQNGEPGEDGITYIYSVPDPRKYGRRHGEPKRAIARGRIWGGTTGRRTKDTGRKTRNDIQVAVKELVGYWFV